MACSLLEVRGCFDPHETSNLRRQRGGSWTCRRDDDVAHHEYLVDSLSKQPFRLVTDRAVKAQPHFISTGNRASYRPLPAADKATLDSLISCGICVSTPADLRVVLWIVSALELSMSAPKVQILPLRRPQPPPDASNGSTSSRSSGDSPPEADVKEKKSRTSKPKVRSGCVTCKTRRTSSPTYRSGYLATAQLCLTT